MRCLGKLTAVFSFLLLSAGVSPAQQERSVVMIDKGSISIAGFNSRVIFSFGSSTTGFSVSNLGTLPGLGDDGSFLGCMPCAPGSRTIINANFVGEETLGYGPATVDGVTYERIYYSGAFTLSAPVITLPVEVYPLISNSVPFTMHGYVQGFATSQNTVPSGAPLFEKSFKGQGVATLKQHGFPFPFLPYYQFAEVTYRFTDRMPRLRKDTNRPRLTRKYQ